MTSERGFRVGLRGRRIPSPSGRFRTGLLALLVTLGVSLGLPGSAGAVGPAIQLQPLVDVPGSPVAISHTGDARLFITLQEGAIVVYDGTKLLGTPFLDLSGLISCCGEQGLLNLAFHPEYAANGFFYVYYTNGIGDIVIARFAVSAANPNVADPASEGVLLTIPHLVGIQRFSNHNGGSLVFGPDGYLYAGVGDGGSGGDPANNAQNLGVLLGKLLRLDVDGGPPYVPPGNPFGDLIWALGLRNPWRTSFDRLTGDLFIGDVGQDSREEVDFQPAGSAGGQNYCWRRLEGTLVYNSATPCVTGTPTPPILEYSHVDGNCAITGGYRYRGSGIASLQGVYVYGDFCSGEIWGATQALDGSWTSTPLLTGTGLLISSFGEDAEGELYVLDLNGHVYRMRDAASVTVARNGTGSGTVSGGPIACGLTCSGSYDPEASVTLTPTADPGSAFTGWSGDCAGTGTCTVSGSGAHAVTATFMAVSVLQFKAPAQSVSEGSASVSVGVSRTGSTAGTVTVHYATVAGGTAVPGTDYTPTSGILTFAAGKTSQTFRVTLLNDTVVDGARTVALALDTPSPGGHLGPLSTALVTINDNDVAGALAFSASSYRVGEDRGSVTITVKRSGGSAGGVTVRYSAVPGGLAPATPGFDFTPVSGVLTFGPAQSKATFTIPVLPDGIRDGDKTVALTLDTPTGGATLGSRPTATLTITDVD